MENIYRLSAFKYVIATSKLENFILQRTLWKEESEKNELSLASHHLSDPVHHFSGYAKYLSSASKSGLDNIIIVHTHG